MPMPLYREEEDQRTIGQLFSDLSQNLSTLVNKEIQLARIEMSAKASSVSKDAVLIGIGAALAYGGFMVLLAAVVIWLAYWMPLWLSVLIVSAATLLAGGVLVIIGKNRLQKKDIKPTQTIASIKENTRWIRQQTR